MYQGLIEKYRDRLPVDDKTPVVSLNEGDTPLIELKNLPAAARRKVRSSSSASEFGDGR